LPEQPADNAQQHGMAAPHVNAIGLKVQFLDSTADTLLQTFKFFVNETQFLKPGLLVEMSIVPLF